MHPHFIIDYSITSANRTIRYVYLLWIMHFYLVRGVQNFSVILAFSEGCSDNNGEILSLIISSKSFDKLERDENKFHEIR